MLTSNKSKQKLKVKYKYGNIDLVMFRIQNNMLFVNGCLLKAMKFMSIESSNINKNTL